MTAALCALLGVALAVRALAALYAVVDLRPVMAEVWPRVAAGLVAWLGLPILLVVLLPDGLRLALLGGMAAVVIVQLLLYLAVVPLIRRRSAP